MTRDPQGSTRSPPPGGVPFDVVVAAGGLRVGPAAGAGSSTTTPAISLDASSARDLEFFLARIDAEAVAEFRRPVGIVVGTERRTVELHATRGDDGAWHLELGAELDRDRAPDRSDVVDARLAELATMVWVTDAERLARWFNDAWLSFVGRSLDDQLGWGWMRCVHPDDLLPLLETYEAAQQSGRGFECAARVTDRHDRYWWMLTRAAPRLGGDAFEGFVGMCEVLNADAAREAPPLPAGLTDVLSIAELTGLPAAEVVGRLTRLDGFLECLVRKRRSRPRYSAGLPRAGPCSTRACAIVTTRSCSSSARRPRTRRCTRIRTTLDASSSGASCSTSTQ